MKKYRVTLESQERKELEQLLARGRTDVRRLKHAQILLAADESSGLRQNDVQIALALNIGTATVERIRRKFVEECLERALSPYRTDRRRWGRKLNGRQEAQLIATACSKPPEGRSRWTLKLLADQMAELKLVKSISYETIRRTLKKTNLSLI